jgi:hypothetical protein
MRILLGIALCFAFVLTGCSGEDVKTDVKNVKPPDKASGSGHGQRPGSRMVN